MTVKVALKSKKEIFTLTTIENNAGLIKNNNNNLRKRVLIVVPT